MPAPLIEALFNSIAVPVLAIDDSGNLLDLNNAARRLLPPNSSASGQRLEVIFPALKALLTHLQARHEEFRQEVEFDSGRVTEALVTRIPTQGWAITLYDVSTYKEMERTKTNLLSEVVHDLKQPLTAIQSFSEIVQSMGDLSARQQQYLGRIHKSASRMLEQVHQLLDIAWIESGMKLTLVEVDLVNLVRITLDDLEPAASVKHISLLLDAPMPVPIIMGDNTRLSQVFINLITNAIKYSTDGSSITVKVEKVVSQAVFSVIDTGMGISAADMPHLFQRFYRVHTKETRNIEGTGLGLYISRSIVEQHGGQITIESEPGHGTIVRISLPLNIITSQIKTKL
ncbi:MAG: HAMP domain-containing sensor histidine kinase [Chloroflexota bacterium]